MITKTGVEMYSAALKHRPAVEYVRLVATPSFHNFIKFHFVL
jgi:hypothetical protein